MSERNDVLAVLAAASDLLARVDFARLVSDEVMTVNAAVSVLAGRTRLVQTKLASRMQQLAAEGTTAPPEDLLGRPNGMSNDASARLARHARLLEQFPAFARLLGDGRIADGHLDALTAHLRLLSDANQVLCVASGDRLAGVAEMTGVEDFGSHLAKIRRELDAKNGVTPKERAVRRNSMTGGIDNDMARWLWNLNLDPVAGERLDTALRAEMKRLRDTGELDPDIADIESRLRAVALGNLVSNGFQTDRNPASNGAVCEIGIIIDEHTWLNGSHDDTVCETRTGLPVDLDHVKRLACEAGIYRIVMNADSIVIDLGRTHRLATPAQRRALRAMYATCAVHGCHTPFHRCEIHHLDPANGDNTTMSNLVPICSRHHHLIHDNGWRAHLTDTRVLTLQRPDGTWDEPQPLRPLATRPPDPPPPDPSPGRPPDGPPGQGDLFVA